MLKKLNMKIKLARGLKFSSFVKVFLGQGSRQSMRHYFCHLFELCDLIDIFPVIIFRPRFPSILFLYAPSLPETLKTLRLSKWCERHQV